jgi:hypothetical protein
VLIHQCDILDELNQAMAHLYVVEDQTTHDLGIGPCRNSLLNHTSTRILAYRAP